MDAPKPASSRKPRRLGLYGPFILLAIVVVAWSGVWLWLRAEVERRLDAERQRAPLSGHVLTWETRRVYGFPFRLDMDFTGFNWRDPSGWSVTVPKLKTEAFAFAPGHWVAMAPDGVTLDRPRGGPVVVTARVLRASLFDTDAHPPRVSVEGLNLTFSPASGAAPFFVQTAREIHIHTRAGPADQGAFHVSLEGAQADPSAFLGRIAAGKPLTILADAIYSHASALAGRNWPVAAHAWSEAGGALRIRQLRIHPGDADLEARSGDLTVGPDGRLRGEVPVRLVQAQRALTAMAQVGSIAPETARVAAVTLTAAGSPTPVNVDFLAGRATLGPVALGAAPKVY